MKEPGPLTDHDFVLAFESCSLPPERFRHRNHLRLAWWYLQDTTLGAAEALMEGSIRRYAAHHGASSKYHHTITVFWVRAVMARRAGSSAALTFDAFLEAHPELLDKALIERFYSPGLLASEEARSRFVESDLPKAP